jgi:hypothetical protein
MRQVDDGRSSDFAVGQHAKVFMTGDAQVLSSDSEQVQWKVADATLSAELADPVGADRPAGEAAAPAAAAE